MRHGETYTTSDLKRLLILSSETRNDSPRGYQFVRCILPILNKLNDYVGYMLPDWKATTDFGSAIDLEGYQRGMKNRSEPVLRVVYFHWSSLNSLTRR
jgi:hypothetical protein